MTNGGGAAPKRISFTGLILGKAKESACRRVQGNDWTESKSDTSAEKSE